MNSFRQVVWPIHDGEWKGSREDSRRYGKVCVQQHKVVRTQGERPRPILDERAGGWWAAEAAKWPAFIEPPWRGSQD